MCGTTTRKEGIMYIASMVIKAVSDVARTKHIAKPMGDQDVHGWITAALSLEMTGLDGHANMSRAQALAQARNADSVERKKRMDEKKGWEFILTNVKVEASKCAALCGPTLDYDTLKGTLGADDEGVYRGS